MLKFRITEIPEGYSTRSLTLDSEAVDLDPYEFTGGKIDIEFHRTLHHIRVNFEIRTDVELVCDRSLEAYLHEVEAAYEVVFKAEDVEETEDENGAVRMFNFAENTFSIAEEVRDTILLDIPAKKLHPKYLDENGNPIEFEDRSFGKADNEDQKADDEPADPRFAELKKLKNNND